MNDDVRGVVYATLIGFVAIVLAWLSLIYISSCGFTLNCVRGDPLVVRTPIPTLIPVSHAEEQGPEVIPDFDDCLVSATDLVGAWVNAGSPETEPFPFSGVDGNSCQATYAEDVQHLFVENNIWYAGQLGCTSCHNAELTERSGGLDLSTFEGVLAGDNGEGILGGGDWESSTLHDVLVEQALVSTGHSAEAEPHPPVFFYAGQQTDEVEATPTP